MKARYHIPIRAAWRVEAPSNEKASLERAIIIAIERAVRSRAERDSEIMAIDLQPPEDAIDRLGSSGYQSEPGSDAIPT